MFDFGAKGASLSGCTLQLEEPDRATTASDGLVDKVHRQITDAKQIPTVVESSSSLNFWWRVTMVPGEWGASAKGLAAPALQLFGKSIHTSGPVRVLGDAYSTKIHTIYLYIILSKYAIIIILYKK